MFGLDQKALHRLWEGVLWQMGWNAVDHTTDTSSFSNIGKWDIYGPFNIAGGSTPNGTQSFFATKVFSTCPSLLDGSLFGEQLPLVSKTRTLWKLPFGGGSVMVWSGISADTKTPLVVIRGNLNAERYLNEVLATQVVSLFQQNAV